MTSFSVDRTFKVKLVMIFMTNFIFHNGFCQNQSSADSVKNMLANNEISGDSLLLRAYVNISLWSSNPDECIEYAERAIELAQKSHHEIIIASMLHVIGSNYRIKGDVETSLIYLRKAAEKSENVGDGQGYAETLTEMASTYDNNRDYLSAISYYNQAISIFRKTKSSQTLSLTLINLGWVFYEMDKLDSASKCYEEAILLSKKVDLLIVKAYAKGNMALVTAKRGNLDQAESEIREALSMLQTLGDNFGIADYTLQLGRIYTEKGKYEGAILLAQKAYNLASQEDFKEQARDASKLLYRSYKAEKDFEKALAYQELHIAYRDSITDTETVRNLANQRTAFEVGQKQIELDLMTAEKKTQEVILWSIIAFAFLLVILAVVIYVFYRSKMRTNKILEEQKRELERVNSTKDKFFSIISHDLRGPVASFYGISRMIKFLVESKDTEQLLEITEHIDQSVAGLTSLLDNLLGWAMQQQGEFPYAPEAVALKPIAVELEATFRNMAQSKKIGLSMEIAESITLLADKNMIATAIRNLVNNALKFTKEGDSVIISAQTEGNLAHIQIKDTGVGIPADKLEKLFGIQEKKSTYGTSGEKGLGLGLQLVYEFVGANKGRIEVESEVDKGTTFHLFIPVFEG